MTLYAITYPNITKYHKHFNEHKHARSFIDQMKTQKQGTLYINNQTNPDYLHYQNSGVSILAGRPNHEKINQYLSKIQANDLVIYPNKNWETPIQQKFGDKVTKITMQHFDSSTLEINHLRKITDNIPSGYHLKKIGTEEAGYIDKEIRPFITSSFNGPSGFVERGVGFCVMSGEKVASFAASYFPYSDYLEIHVETHRDFTRKGLATIVSAKLIEYCLKSSIEPVWTASNEISSKMAFNLGYSNPKSYDACFITS